MNKERLVKTFTDLVALDSPSFDEQAVCRYIKERLTALGVQVAEDDSAAATGSTCGNLLATIPGDPSLEPVLFAAHMDTVEPMIRETENFSIYSLISRRIRASGVSNI
jgi:tripeptide aminopeptidase